MKKVLFTLIVLSLASIAHANPAQMGKTAEEKYKQMDSNSNNEVTVEEFSAVYPTMKPAVFDIIDKDKNKIIDIKEWILFQEEHMSGMKQEQSNTVPSSTGNHDMNKGTKKEGGKMLIMPPASK